MFEYDNYFNSTQDLQDILDKNDVRLLKDLVIIEPIDDMNIGSFHITDKHTDKDVYTTNCRGVVKLVGEGRRTSKGALVKPEVKIGDTVVLSRAYMVREKVKGGYVYITKERDILGIEENDVQT